MDASQATSHVLEAGQSAELSAAFRCIGEATAPDGGPKYAPRVCQALARAIVCRTYAKLVLQLCHLVNAADACAPPGASYETLFFSVPRAAPSAFRGHVEEAIGVRTWRRSGFESSGEGIVIHYADAVFNVPYARMPLMAALLEFLLTIGDYLEIDAIFSDMLDEPTGIAAIERAASRVESRLYHTLGEHLPSAQNNRKFHRILAFLRDRAEDDSIEIDDDGIVAFWRRNSTAADDEAVDFRMYRTVLQAFIAFARALETARSRRGLDGAAPLGGDREAGEVDPGAVSEVAGDGPEWRSPLPLLDEEPARGIKFLNKRERDDLALVMDCGPLSRRLPLSVLRAEVFGLVQGRLTQALRRKSAAGEIRTLIHAPGADYGAREVGFAKLLDHVQRVLRAAAHVLLNESAAQGGPQGGPQGGNVVALGAADPAAHFERLCREPAAVDGERLSAALDEAKRAFRGLARQGFEDDRVGTPALTAGFRLGVDVLQTIDRELGAYLATLRQIENEGGLDRRFEHDREVFREQFMLIYGETA